MEEASEVNKSLEHLFRREAGRLVAVLTKIFGPGQIDLAETVVQDALIRAAQTWPLTGIPDNPTGWIMQVAKNRALDLIKRRRELSLAPESLNLIPDSIENDPTMHLAFESEIQDDQLRLMFICCHPSVPYEGRIALTLKTICGFGVAEIARAFLAKEEAVAQRLVRAKRKIRAEDLAFAMPEGDELPVRLDSVLDTVYLLFNEGYGASHGDLLVKEDICSEACRLSRLLADQPVLGAPRVHALAALLHLQASRLNARVDENGEVLLLEEQNRELWDQDLIGLGLSYLEQAASGEQLSEYHLLAGIAACHALAKAFQETDWARILSYYDELMARNQSPIIALNRAVAASFVHGVKPAIKELKALKDSPQLKGYYLFPATVADLHRRIGEYQLAKGAYQEALQLVGTEPERRFLRKRIAQCNVNLPKE